MEGSERVSGLVVEPTGNRTQKVDSHEERFNRGASHDATRPRSHHSSEKTVAESRGGDAQVHNAESGMQNLATRVGAVPIGAPVPAVIRRQRWSPFIVPTHLGSSGS